MNYLYHKLGLLIVYLFCFNILFGQSGNPVINELSSPLTENTSVKASQRIFLKHGFNTSGYNLNTKIDKLVGSWSFNDGTTNDDSGNGIHGNSHNVKFVEDRFGNPESACEFDGTSTIQFDDESFDFKDHFSISFWIKTHSNETNQMWFYKDAAKPNKSWYVKLNESELTDGKFHFLLSNNGNNLYQTYYSTSNDYNNWRWHHVVLIFNGPEHKVTIYKDNLIDEEGYFYYDTINQNNTVFTISPLNNPCFGILDDVKIYNKAISEIEVTELYQEPNPSGLVGSWTFNDGSLDDESGNGNHGDATNVTFVKDRFENTNSACEFSGSSTIEFNDASFDFKEAFSISFWIKTNSTQVDERWFFKNNDSPNRSWFLSLNRNTIGQLTLFYSDDGINYRNFHSGSTNYNDGNWHHIVLVFDGTSGITRIYKDNILDGEDNSALNYVHQNDQIFTISPLQNAGKGIMDDVKVYNRVITQTEIDELYNAPNSNGIVASWSFNDGTANDNSGNGNHGTATNVSYINDRFGNPGSACYFDGTATILFNDESFDFSEEFSVSFWMKTTSTKLYQSWFYKDGWTPNMAWSISDNSQSPGQFKFFHSSTGEDYNHFNATSNNYNNGYWNHVVVVFDGKNGETRFYKNNRLDGIDTKAFHFVNQNDKIFAISPPEGLIVGALDDVNVYEKAISTSKIAELYYQPNHYNLVGSWNFNGGTVKDKSGNENHGLAQNVTFVDDRFGNFQNACEFNGTSSIAFQDESFDFVDQFSISFWLKTTSTQSNEMWFYKNDDFPNSAWYFSLNNNSDGQFTLFYSDDGTNYKYLHSTSNNYNDGNWHHVVLIFNGITGVTRIYKDNILDGEDNSAFNFVNNNDITFSISPLQNACSGSLDDVTMYNYAISAAQIDDLFNAPNPLIGSWSFNNGTANDESGNENHGSTTNVSYVNDRFDNPGTACYFDGTATIQFNDESFDFEREFSISFWMKTTSSHHQIWFRKGIYYDKSWLLSQYGGAYTFVYSDDGYYTNVKKTNSENYNDGNWHHVVLIYDGVSRLIKIYKDNVLDAIERNADQFVSLNDRIFEISDIDYEVTGTIDDVNVYNFPISEIQIDELYNTPNPGMLKSDIVPIFFDDKVTEEDSSDEIILNEEFKVYPNPSDGKFLIDISNFKYDEKACIQIFDMSGREVQNISNLNTLNEIDISNEPSGTYQLRMVTNNKVFESIIIKQ